MYVYARCVYMCVLSMYVGMLRVHAGMYVVYVFIMRVCMLCVHVSVYLCAYVYISDNFSTHDVALA